MGFENLDLLKNKCQEIINLIGFDDQLGFQQNQKLSNKIMKIEHNFVNTKNIQEMITFFQEYSVSWLENFREYCNLIRQFSPKIANDREQESKKIELETRELIKKMNNLNFKNEDEVRQIISEIKILSHKYGSVFNNQKLDCIGIRHQLEEILDSFPKEDKDKK